MKLSDSDKRRFFRKISTGHEDGCWLWEGSLTQKGYGQLSVKDGTRRTHRISWAIFRGEIPSDLCVLHKCDIRHCVNPDHLFLGTQEDNLRDMEMKGRRAIKLSDADVREIRKLRREGLSMARIGKQFGVTRGQVFNIERGISRTDVLD